MKKLLLTTILVAGFAAGILAQGFYLDLTSNTATSSTATSSGVLFDTTGAFLNSTTYPWINAEVFAASSSAGVMSSPIITLTGSANGPTAVGNGEYLDLSGNEYTIPSVVNNGTAYFDIEWWTGTATSYATAAGLIGNTGIFSQATGGSPPVPPAPLTGMPSVVMTPVPEPAICTLVGLGLASLLIFRRRQ